MAADQKRALVIGCDSVLALDGELLGKPAPRRRRSTRWKQMRGRHGVLHTGHCVIDTHREVWLARSAATQVRFAHVTDEEIEAYVATGEPSAVAGAFTLDGLGGAVRLGRDRRPPQRGGHQPAAAPADVRRARLRLDRVLDPARRPGPTPARRDRPSYCSRDPRACALEDEPAERPEPQHGAEQPPTTLRRDVVGAHRLPAEDVARASTGRPSGSRTRPS